MTEKPHAFLGNVENLAPDADIFPWEDRHVLNVELTNTRFNQFFQKLAALFSDSGIHLEPIHVEKQRS